MWTSFLDDSIDAREPQIIAMRRHLHAHPEPSGSEYETSREVFRILSEAGIEARVLPNGRGVIADIGEANAPRIAIRADMDALRIQDEKGVEYSSRRPNLMHACGHDGHTSAVVGAIIGLHELSKSEALPCPINIRAIFQPAEETATGATEMIAAGALENVKAIIALHLDPSRELGRIGIRDGALTAACDDVAFTIHGQGGHAARPHESRDPIAAAAQLISSLYLFVPRATDSNDAVVLTIGQIYAGDSSNVIPNQAHLKGTLRTLEASARRATRETIARVAAGIAHTSGTKIDVQISDGPPSVINYSGVNRVLRQAAAEVLGMENIDTIAKPSMGGEDFAFYLEHIPGAMFRLGCKSSEATGYALHSAKFDIDERALVIGAKTLARAAVLSLQATHDSAS